VPLASLTPLRLYFVLADIGEPTAANTLRPWQPMTCPLKALSQLWGEGEARVRARERAPLSSTLFSDTPSVSGSLVVLRLVRAQKPRLGVGVLCIGGQPEPDVASACGVAGILTTVRVAAVNPGIDLVLTVAHLERLRR